MNRPLQRLTVLTAIAVMMSTVAGKAAPRNDEAEIRAVVTRQGETWTRHDAKAYAALFADDCDVVNVAGMDVEGTGRARAKADGGVRLRVPRQPTHDHGRPGALPVARDCTGARSMDDVRGEDAPGDARTRMGIQTLVFTKTTGQWLITGFQNTNGVPGAAVPVGAAGGSEALTHPAGTYQFTLLNRAT